MKDKKYQKSLKIELHSNIENNIPFINNMFCLKLTIDAFIMLMQNAKNLPITKLWLSHINISDHCVVFIPETPKIIREINPLEFNEQQFTLSDILNLMPRKLTHLDLKFNHFPNITPEDFFNLLKTNITNLDLQGHFFSPEEISTIKNLCSLYNVDCKKISNLFLIDNNNDELPILTLMSGFIDHNINNEPIEIIDLIISYLDQDMYLDIIF